MTSFSLSYPLSLVLDFVGFLGFKSSSLQCKNNNLSVKSRNGSADLAHNYHGIDVIFLHYLLTLLININEKAVNTGRWGRGYFLSALTSCCKLLQSPVHIKIHQRLAFFLPFIVKKSKVFPLC